MLKSKLINFIGFHLGFYFSTSIFIYKLRLYKEIQKIYILLNNFKIIIIK